MIMTAKAGLDRNPNLSEDDVRQAMRYNLCRCETHAEILQALFDVAKDVGRTPAQVALRWVMDQPNMTSAIVGARNAEQLKETLAAVGWRLPDEACARLDKVSAQARRYPRAFEDPMPERRKSAIKMPGS